MFVQTTLHCSGVPVRRSFVHGSPSSHDVGHGLVLLDGSHVSVPLTTPSPQLAEHSESSPLLQPFGQQPSPGLQAVISDVSQVAEHFDASPSMDVVMQASLDWQLAEVGQLEGGSHVSPPSSTPLPHVGLQSGSLSELPSLGQQPSA